MLRFRWLDGVSLGLVGLTAAIGALVRDRLPERVATHFDLYGTPNGWMDRTVAVLFMPIVALVLWALIRLSYYLMPEERRRRTNEGALPLVAAMTVAFLAAVQASILHVALVPGAGIMRLLALLLGLFWIGNGLVLPRLRRNPFVGVRTAWTLSSPENWERTNRFASRTMCAGGVFGLFMSAWNTPASVIAGIAGMLLAALLPAAYSLVISFRRSI
jgi:uncharacterized membrane protein